ncbi:MAG TPA: hypothetical protein GX529_10215 [Firmicutes bacterium]|nr:hypothetical protein [Candidatus Fermentithermobacillaceae bacterium]
MPLFQISGKVLSTVEQAGFATEKELQQLIEANLETVFNCRFIASEFWTGNQHAGRIDTLALSEENNPVIIEYKRVESSELINQSLFYLHWLADHRGDFELAVFKKIGNISVDWSDIRVICIAPNYRKYDLYAVQMMGANIELWRYRLYENNVLHLEEIHRASKAIPGNEGKDPVMVDAGRKAAITRATGVYTFQEHIENKPEEIKDLAIALQEFILALDPAMDEAPKKYYIAYRITQNIVCVEVQMQRLLLYIKLDPKELDSLPPNARDVSDIGHFGTGDLELSVKSEAELAAAKPFVEMAYKKLGG